MLRTIVAVAVITFGMAAPIESVRAGSLPPGVEPTYGLINERGNVGGYAQLTKDIAVTAAHLKVRGSVLSVPCVDVQFIERKGMALNWRQPAWHESVRSFGFRSWQDGTITETVIPGTTAKTVVSMCDGRFMAFTHSGIPNSGVSGGPVIGEDGAALGITIGASYDPEAQAEVAVFIPYHIIRALWESQGKIQACYLHDCPPLPVDQTQSERG
ncbi:hypothetical protein [Achromobacter spanius]|uniref:hypothetical protein n=1 Tax=Achromobacter spanius TaxID=217203 RepID=UPI0037FCD6F4